jgi:hypothetical protein
MPCAPGQPQCMQGSVGAQVMWFAALRCRLLRTGPLVNMHMLIKP